MWRTASVLTLAAPLLAFGCAGSGSRTETGRPADRLPEPWLVRDPDKIPERGELRMVIYDVRDLGPKAELVQAVEGLVKSCARGGAGGSVESRNGKLAVVAGRPAHRLIAELVTLARQRPRSWVPADQWRDSFRRAVAGADRVTVAGKAIAEPAGVAAFIAGFEFRDAYSGVDCESRLRPRIQFYRGGQLLGGLEHLPGENVTWLRWDGKAGPWDGNAALTAKSAAWLAGLLPEGGPETGAAGRERER
jgi:hypothetical protein